MEPLKVRRCRLRTHFDWTHWAIRHGSLHREISHAQYKCSDASFFVMSFGKGVTPRPEQLRFVVIGRNVDRKYIHDHPACNVSHVASQFRMKIGLPARYRICLISSSLTDYHTFNASDCGFIVSCVLAGTVMVADDGPFHIPLWAVHGLEIMFVGPWLWPSADLK